jgi:hypothetical protein
MFQEVEEHLKVVGRVPRFAASATFKFEEATNIWDAILVVSVCSDMPLTKKSFDASHYHWRPCQS